MGFYVGATLPDGTHIGEKVGTNGSQLVMMGYWFAAYAVAGRPESNRVCAWVGPGWRWNDPFTTGVAWPQRNQPATVRALIAYSEDEDGDGVMECGFCCAQVDTINLGRKMKPITDPMLADLLELYDNVHTNYQTSGTLSVDLTRRLADHFDFLVQFLRSSESWFETMLSVQATFRVAADAGVGVHAG